MPYFSTQNDALNRTEMMDPYNKIMNSLNLCVLIKLSLFVVGTAGWPKVLRADFFPSFLLHEQSISKATRSSKQINDGHKQYPQRQENYHPDLPMTWYIKYYFYAAEP